MVKTFLSSSALAAVLLCGLSGTSATAEVVPPALKINGFSSADIYFTGQKNHRNGKKGPQPHIAVDASDLYFTIAGIAGGIEYQYRIALNTISGFTGDPIVDQNYIQVKGCFGIFQIGDVSGPTNTMVKDASSVIGGAGGFSGVYTNVYNMSAGVMYKDDNIGDSGKSTKVVYYTPEFFGGFTVAVAYTPNTSHSGDGKWNNLLTGAGPTGNRGLWTHKDHPPFGLRNISGGITYKRDLGNKWSITLSAAGLTEKSYIFQSGTRMHLRNARAYQLGGIVAYDTLQLGLGYLNNGKSRLPKQTGFTVKIDDAPASLGDINRGNSGRAFNAGLAYSLGAYKVAGSYQRTDRKTAAHRKATGDVYSATVDVVPFQGFKGYVEVDHISTRTNSAMVATEQALIGKRGAAIGNNNATVLILGTAVSF